MDDQQREDLKAQIKARMIDLEALLMQPLTSSSSDARKRSDDESASLDKKISSAVDLQVMQNERRELAMLKKNLQWLDSADAGYCEACGNEIPFARLQAVPATRLCVHCAD